MVIFGIWPTCIFSHLLSPFPVENFSSRCTPKILRNSLDWWGLYEMNWVLVESYILLRITSITAITPTPYGRAGDTIAPPSTYKTAYQTHSHPWTLRGLEFNAWTIPVLFGIPLSYRDMHAHGDCPVRVSSRRINHNSMRCIGHDLPLWAAGRMKAPNSWSTAVPLNISG